MTATATEPQAPTLDSVIGELVRVLRTLGRDDLVGRATAAGARLHRPSTIVCVVGEFKQGKSSLVNGLLGADVCPVDDDLATSAITLVRYGETSSAIVRRREGDQAVADQIPVADLGGWVSERGNPGNEKQVERVEITAPSAILRQGLALVDTPGMGGLGAGHAAATLAFLPFADGLILVSDASAELSAPEVEFLQRAVELCPTVLFAQTKTDLYPAWERIVEINKGHLARAGIDIPVVAVSNTLRSEALARRDRSLNALSHFPELIEDLGTSVVEPAKAHAEERSKRDIRGITALVRAVARRREADARRPEHHQGRVGRPPACDRTARAPTWPRRQVERRRRRPRRGPLERRQLPVPLRHADDLACDGRARREPQVGQGVGRHGAPDAGAGGRRGHPRLRRHRRGPGQHPRRGRDACCRTSTCRCRRRAADTTTRSMSASCGRARRSTTAVAAARRSSCPDSPDCAARRAAS